MVFEDIAWLSRRQQERIVEVVSALMTLTSRANNEPGNQNRSSRYTLCGPKINPLRSRSLTFMRLSCIGVLISLQVFPPSSVRAIAPPLPTASWIQVDVSNQFAEIAIRLAEDRLVPPLKQVADLLVLSIVILTVTGEQAMHHATDPLVQHLRHQMHVIGHQAVSIQVEGSLGFLGLEKSKKLKIVIVGTENAPAIIATGDDVVASYFNSRFPHHGAQEQLPGGQMSIFLP